MVIQLHQKDKAYAFFIVIFIELSRNNHTFGVRCLSYLNNSALNCIFYLKPECLDFVASGEILKLDICKYEGIKIII